MSREGLQGPYTPQNGHFFTRIEFPFKRESSLLGGSLSPFRDSQQPLKEPSKLEQNSAIFLMFTSLFNYLPLVQLLTTYTLIFCLQGRYPDANGCYPDANGRYPDANGYYPDANGRYPDANVCLDCFDLMSCCCCCDFSIRAPIRIGS